MSAAKQQESVVLHFLAQHA